MTYAVARKRGAKDWFHGISLGTNVVGGDHEIRVHHIFPKAILGEIGVSRRDRDEIANLAFLAARPNRQISKRPPEQYLSEIAAEHPDHLQAQSVGGAMHVFREHQPSVLHPHRSRRVTGV